MRRPTIPEEPVEHFFIGRPDHYPHVRALDVAISAQDHLCRVGPSLIKYWTLLRCLVHFASEPARARRKRMFVFNCQQMAPASPDLRSNHWLNTQSGKSM
ncbi:MAG: hypothetical protein WBM28_01240 [Burkholderiales bacterium]